MTVDLSQTWTWGDPLGGDPAGFGKVVEAFDENGQNFAAKFVKKAPGATREMLLANLDGVRNVVPVVDSGEVGDSYVLVMPLADKSLRRHIVEHGPLDLQNALHILVDIATALGDLEAKVVHRDLKPENVLLLNGTWCLADFGISRYADATTEVGETRKDYWTGAYAAPEQWTGERATSQTDIYAFGVMAYELLQGERPFNGDWYELRNHHLHTDPPAPTVTAVLASLVQECLFKSPGSRPSAKNVLAKLQRQVEAAGDSRWGALAIANHAEVQKRVAEDAESRRAESEAQRRQRLYGDSLISWQRMSDRFKEIIDEHLPTAKVTVRRDKHWYVELGPARFGVSYPRQRWEPEGIGFDVISTSTVSVVMDNSANPNRAITWDGRSHSLYFGDPIREGEYGWFETAFMDISFSMRHVIRRIEPYAMEDVDSMEAAHALGNVVAPQQVAWPFTLIDSGDCDDFVQRWLEWFAAAAQLKLQRPSRMPEQDVTPNWRR